MPPSLATATTDATPVSGKYASLGVSRSEKSVVFNARDCLVPPGTSCLRVSELRAAKRRFRFIDVCPLALKINLIQQRSRTPPSAYSITSRTQTVRSERLRAGPACTRPRIQRTSVSYPGSGSPVPRSICRTLETSAGGSPALIVPSA